MWPPKIDFRFGIYRKIRQLKEKKGTIEKYT